VKPLVSEALAARAIIRDCHGETVETVESWRQRLVMLLDRVKTYAADPGVYNLTRLHFTYMCSTGLHQSAAPQVLALNILEMVMAVVDDYYENPADLFTDAITNWEGFSGDRAAPIKLSGGDLWAGENARQQISFAEFVCQELQNTVDLAHWTEALNPKNFGERNQKFGNFAKIGQN